jgi:hypothetical protein
VNLQTLIPSSANTTLGSPAEISDNGDIVAAATGPGNTQEWVVLQPAGVSIASGNPVPEPAIGSAPETFTITTPASATPVTVHYKTVDGTGAGGATAAANDYTAIADGSVTIPTGQTSAPIQVQVKTGSGHATTPTEAFQVKLTSSSGPPITVPTAGGAIVIPGITGKLTDDTGAIQPAHRLTLTGAATTGQAVTQHPVTDGGGRYQLYADPGTYTLTPDPPSHSAATFEAVGCPGTAKAGACADVGLVPGANLSIDFKTASLVVNSTAVDADPQASLDQRICDTTPSQATATCTLPAAIDVANKLGGGSITFKIPGGGVPRIVVSKDLANISAPIVIDGTTQPGTSMVELSGAGAQTGLIIAGGSSTVRGLVINGFCRQLRISGFTSSGENPAAGGNVVQGDLLGTDPSGTQARPAHGACDPGAAGLVIDTSSGNLIGGSGAGQGNVISGNRGAGLRELAGHANMIQGNTIGPARGGRTLLGSDQHTAVSLFNSTGSARGSANTLGGSTRGAGNVLTGENSHIDEDRDVVQGNVFVDTQLGVTGRGNTIGGGASAPGTGAGNDFQNSVSPALFVDGEGAVIQGNHIHGTETYGLFLDATRSTVGGSRANLGNLIEVNRTDPGDPAGASGVRVNAGAGNGIGSPDIHVVIAHNRILDNAGDGGVTVFHGSGVTITANEMRGNKPLGINLGGGAFHFNQLNGDILGPNHHQRYPNLLGSSAGATIRAVLRLDDGILGRHHTFTIDLYSQAGCSRDAITPGQGARLVQSDQVTTDGFGAADATLSFPHTRAKGDHALTATATADDGSTSEFSPCLTIGRQALAFAQHGVQVQDSRVDLTPTPPQSQATDAAASRHATTKHRTLYGTLHVFCPPRTARACTGSVLLVVPARNGQKALTIALIKFKLAPGQLAALRFQLPAAALKRFAHTHYLRALATVTAHDGAKHPKRRTGHKTMILMLAK